MLALLTLPLKCRYRSSVIAEAGEHSLADSSIHQHRPGMSLGRGGRLHREENDVRREEARVREHGERERGWEGRSEGRGGGGDGVGERSGSGGVADRGGGGGGRAKNPVED